MAVNLDDSGERMVPEYHKGSMMYGEHLVRYKAATALVKKKIVLDIACGSGYGSNMLAAEAKKVIGVDLNQPAIDYAREHYSSEKIEFKIGDAVEIPLEDKSVDVVVSFETIEHIQDYKKFVAEVKRVLRDGGQFIVSTPNDTEFPEGADFHVHEFKQMELEELLGSFFKNVETYYQSTWLYNALLNKKLIASNDTTEMVTINAAPIEPAKSVYFLMVCSDSKPNQLLPSIGAISERWTTKDMLEHNAKMDKYIRGTIKHFEKILKLKDKELDQLRRELHELKTELDIKNTSWLKKTKAKTLNSSKRPN